MKFDGRPDADELEEQEHLYSLLTKLSDMVGKGEYRIDAIHEELEEESNILRLDFHRPHDDMHMGTIQLPVPNIYYVGGTES